MQRLHRGGLVQVGDIDAVARGVIGCRFWIVKDRLGRSEQGRLCIHHASEQNAEQQGDAPFEPKAEFSCGIFERPFHHTVTGNLGNLLVAQASFSVQGDAFGRR